MYIYIYNITYIVRILSQSPGFAFVLFFVHLLRWFDLSQNALEVLDEDSLDTPSLRAFNVSSNQLRHLVPGVFQKLGMRWGILVNRRVEFKM